MHYSRWALSTIALVLFWRWKEKKQSIINFNQAGYTASKWMNYWMMIFFGVLFSFCFLWVDTTDFSIQYIEWTRDLLNLKCSKAIICDDMKAFLQTCQLTSEGAGWRGPRRFEQRNTSGFSNFLGSLKINEFGENDSFVVIQHYLLNPLRVLWHIYVSIVSRCKPL